MGRTHGPQKTPPHTNRRSKREGERERERAGNLVHAILVPDIRGGGTRTPHSCVCPPPGPTNTTQLGNCCESKFLFWVYDILFGKEHQAGALGLAGVRITLALAAEWTVSPALRKTVVWRCFCAAQAPLWAWMGFPYICIGGIHTGTYRERGLQRHGERERERERTQGGMDTLDLNSRDEGPVIRPEQDCSKDADAAIESAQSAVCCVGVG